MRLPNDSRRIVKPDFESKGLSRGRLNDRFLREKKKTCEDVHEPHDALVQRGISESIQVLALNGLFCSCEERGVHVKLQPREQSKLHCNVKSISSSLKIP